MYTRFLLLASLLVGSFTVRAQTTPQLLDSMVRQFAAHKKFSGSVLVAKDGKILLEKGYGYKNVAEKSPADAKGLYQYGSVTKQFTAALILKLQEQVKLKLEDKLSKYFPQFSFGDSVTLHHLLTHTSGIFNYTNDRRFMSSDEPTKPISQQRIFEFFEKKPLEFQPGSKFSYSNSNYMLLGYIAEKVTGKPYETMVRQYILQPAGMRTAGFDFAHLQSADKVTGYNAIDEANGFVAGIVDSSVSYAAGALYGSVYDLYAWHLAMQNGRLLNKQSLQLMNAAAKEHYALGVVVDSLYGRPRISHGGGIFGFISDFVRYPEDNLVIVVLSNNSSASIGDIARNLAGLVFNQPVNWPAAKVAVSVPVATLNQYVGEYELMPNFIITITVEDGKLMGQPTGQPKAQLFAESSQKFFLKVVDAQVQFNQNAEGQVESLTLFQGGREIKGKKIK